MEEPPWEVVSSKRGKNVSLRKAGKLAVTHGMPAGLEGPRDAAADAKCASYELCFQMKIVLLYVYYFIIIFLSFFWSSDRSVQLVSAALERAIADVRAASFYITLREAFAALPTLHNAAEGGERRRFGKALLLGLGPLSRSAASRCQLALGLLLIEEFGEGTSRQ